MAEKTQNRVVPGALAFVVLMGIVSLLSDFTHEGARSIYGQFLDRLGASATAVGLTAGLGECIGYSARLLTGWIADKSHSYWLMTFIGYVINLLAIPALALVPEHGWALACTLIIAERCGKAIRQPSKNTLVSFASHQLGPGKSFAIQEALDQIGAGLGPLALAGFFWWRRTAAPDGQLTVLDYSLGFAALALPALLTLSTLALAHQKYPHPEAFEPEPADANDHFKLANSYILYIIATSLVAMGFIDFPLLNLHLQRQGIFSAPVLPLLYAWAMIADAGAALALGWGYDRWGLKCLTWPTLLAAGFAPLAFGTHRIWLILLGITLWGIGMGAQESILKAAIATLVPKRFRAMGFGLFATSFGISWFAGSWAAGILYDHNLTAMIVFSVATQLLAVPVFFVLGRLRTAA